jgi:hypothetical protein
MGAIFRNKSKNFTDVSGNRPKTGKSCEMLAEKQMRMPCRPLSHCVSTGARKR